MRCMSLVVILLLSSPAWADDAEKILGDWRLVSFFSEEIQTKQHSNPYGEHPNGFIGFTPGRFFAFVTAPFPIPNPNGSEKMVIGNLVWEKDQ